MATLGQLKPTFNVGIATRQIAVTAAKRVILDVNALRYDRCLMHALLLGRATGKQQHQPRRISKGRDAHVDHTPTKTPGADAATAISPILDQNADDHSDYEPNSTKQPQVEIDRPPHGPASCSMAPIYAIQHQEPVASPARVKQILVNDVHTK
ncbi:MAG: hypothetical protein WBW08_14015 [Methyloceanibacter sp.]